MKLSCVIIEDEQPARELLESFIERIKWLDLVATYKGPLEVNDLDWTKIDILFTDIEMGELSGIDFLKTLTKAPHVIITTAYSEHAIEGYELDIVDYLLKPFPFERFLKAVNKVKTRITSHPTSSDSSKDDDVLLVHADHKTYRIHLDQVVYIEGMREYAGYQLQSGEKIMQLVSLKKLEDELPSHFLRIHKSYIVNKHFIRSFDGVSVATEVKSLPIGSSYKAEIKEVLSS